MSNEYDKLLVSNQIIKNLFDDYEVIYLNDIELPLDIEWCRFMEEICNDLEHEYWNYLSGLAIFNDKKRIIKHYTLKFNIDNDILQLVIRDYNTKTDEYSYYSLNDNKLVPHHYENE